MMSKKKNQGSGTRTSGVSPGRRSGKTQPLLPPGCLLAFDLHQHFHLRQYPFTQIGTDHFYEDYDGNLDALNRASDLSYLPTLELLEQLISEHGKKFRISCCVSGCALELFELYRPDVIQTLQALAQTGQVMFLADTYYRSLSALYSETEFQRQVGMHRQKTLDVTGQFPSWYLHSQGLISSELATLIASTGSKGIVCTLPGAPAARLTATTSGEQGPIRILIRNPDAEMLLARPFANGINGKKAMASLLKMLTAVKEPVVMVTDIRNFGMSNRYESGIFDWFSEALNELISRHLLFITPDDPPDGESLHQPIDFRLPEVATVTLLSGNEMQEEALEKIYRLEEVVREAGDADLLKVWGKLQSQDHFYEMETDAHQPAPSDVTQPVTAFDACISYMNILQDFESTLQLAGNSSEAPDAA